LAKGRPAVVQDTGWTGHIPAGAGLFAFNDIDSAMAGIDCIQTDYSRACLTAREIATEYFDSRNVLTDLLARSVNHV
jgi:hypothetical protein